MFQQCRSKVNVTDAILGKTLSWLCFVDARSRSQLHMAGAFITFYDCLVCYRNSLSSFLDSFVFQWSNVKVTAAFFKC